MQTAVEREKTPLLDDYLEGDEGLAAELNKSPRTIARWRALGEAPPLTRIGKSIYYHRDAVKKWLASRQREAS